MDETREYFRREARRRKKEFQSSGKLSGGILLWADGLFVDGPVDEEVACVEDLRVIVVGVVVWTVVLAVVGRRPEVRETGFCWNLKRDCPLHLVLAWRFCCCGG